MKNSTGVNRKKRAAAARRGSIAANPAINIRDIPDIGTVTFDSRDTKTTMPLFRSEYADLPVVVRRTTKGRRVSVYRTIEGGWFRSGGTVRIQQWSGEASIDSGPRTFVITLYKGANRADLDFLRGVVEQARKGEETRLWRAVNAPWADRETFMMTCARPYEDPYTCWDRAPEIWFCDDERCPSIWHEASDDHEFEEIRNDSYRLVVWRPRQAREWLLSVEAYDCGLDVNKSADLANDIQWLRQTCDKLNASIADPRSVPTPPPTSLASESDRL